MSKITVTTIAGATSGSDANKVKIESGDTLEVTSNATVGGTLGVTGDATFDTDTLKVDSSNNLVGIGTTSPNRKLVVSGAGAEMSLANTSMSADRRNMNWFLTGDKAHWRILNDAGTGGGVSANLDNDGVLDATAFTGTSGTAYNALGSDSIGDSNVPYNSWGTANSTYYRWVLPKAGDYRLESTMRIRLWGVHGMILSRLYNNTTSAVINDKYNYSTVRMNLENRGGGTAELFNIQLHQTWIVTTAADNQDIHHQLFSDNNSASSSVQSDTNGRNYHAWYRIG
jgi:hypothetical protein